MGGNASALFDIEEVQALKHFSSSKRLTDQDINTWELLFSTNLGLRKWLSATPALSRVKVCNFSPHLRTNNVKTFNFQRLIRKTLQQLQILPNDLGVSSKNASNKTTTLISNSDINDKNSRNLPGNGRNAEQMENMLATWGSL